MSPVISAFGVEHGVSKSLHGTPDSGGDRTTQHRMAAAGLAASGVATVGGLHALKATTSENRERKAQLSGHLPAAAKKPSAAAVKLARRIGPARAATVLGGAWLGLHGVELAGDTLAIHAQARELNRTRKPGGDR